MKKNYVGAITVITVILIGGQLSAAQLNKTVPGDLEALLNEADLLKSEGKVEQAMVLYSQVIEQYPAHEYASRLARRSLLHLLFEAKPLDWKAIEIHLNALKNDDSGLGGQFWNYACRLLLHKLSAVEPDKRKEIWTKGLLKHSGDNISLSCKTIMDLDSFIQIAGGDETFSPNQVLIDLLKLNLNDLSRQLLQSRLNACVLRQRFKAFASYGLKPKAIPHQLRRLMFKAHILGCRGDFDQAIILYSKILNEYPRQEEVMLLAGQNILSLFFRHEPPDLDAIHAHINSFSFTSGDFRLNRDLWNFACLLLLRQVSTSPSENQQAVWDKGIKKLSCDNILISEETFTTLDEFTEIIKGDNPSLANRILTDLFLLCPDTLSMRRLQRRRIACFVDQRKWNQALSAGALDIILSITSAEGPRRSTARCIEIMKAAGATAAEQENFKALVCWGPRGNRNNSESESSEQAGVVGMVPLVDDNLKTAALAILKEEANGLSVRRRAWANLFAGNIENALKNIHTTLNQTPVAEHHININTPFDELAMVLAVADGDFQNCSRFAGWIVRNRVGDAAARKGKNRPDPLLELLIQYESNSRSRSKQIMRPNNAGLRIYGRMSGSVRARLAQATFDRWRARLDRWADEALKEGDRTWAQALWALAINEEVDSQIAASLIHKVYSRLRPIYNEQDAIAFLRTILDHMRSISAKRGLLLKIATLLYVQGKFAECLEVIDQADKLAVRPEEKRDMTVGFMHALSLLRLRKFNKAAHLLESMEAWPGTAEQHARAVFLTGWEHMQNDAKTKALFAFRRVVDEFPDTTLAERAHQLIQRLEGM